MKILVEIMHGLGDTVCALPMLKILRESYPQAYIMILTKNDAGKEIIRSSGISINEIKAFNIYKNVHYSIRFLYHLRQMHFDYGISSSITPIRKARYFMKLVNPRHWIGWQKQGIYFDLLHDQYHFVEANLLSIKDICTLPQQKLYPYLHVNTKLLNRFRAELRDVCEKKVIGICIGDADYSLKNRYLRTGKVYTRSWGISNMTALVQLLQKNGFIVVLIGGKSEQHLLTYIQVHIKDKTGIYDFVGKTSIEESIALAALCDVVFGVDTGMQHIAAAAGVKTVSLFGPTNPATHGAYSLQARFLVNRDICDKQFCYGTEYYVNCPNNRVCLKSVSVQSAYSMIVDELIN